MTLEQVAVQMYTLRDHLTTAADLQRSLEKVAAIGYRSIQYSGPRPVAEREIAQRAADVGLTINSSHDTPDEILEAPERLVERMTALGVKLTAMPFPRGVDLTSTASVDAFIDQMNASGEVLAKAGMTLTYHNHNHEFRKLEGEVILDRIYRRTEPRFLQGEPDTYWIQIGGGDPVAWCEKLQDRLPMLHLKDLKTNEDNKPEFAEIGNGNLDFPRIVKAAEASGCQWFIVEQDTTPGDPFDSLAQSLAYIKAHLLDAE